MSEVKVVQFNRTDESLIDLAIDRRARGDLDGALSTLYSLEDRGSRFIEVYAQIALCFMDLGLYTHASNYWFKYLAHAPKTKCVRAYNALGACFFYLDSYDLAGYYFEKQISLDSNADNEFDSVVMEYYDMLFEERKPDIHICYPPEKISSERLLAEGDKYLFNKQFENAINSYSLVSNNDKNYAEAQMKTSTALFLLDKVDESIDTLNQLIERDPQDVTAILNMIGLLYTAGRGEDAQKYFHMCEELELDNAVDCYRLATGYCDKGDDERAVYYLERALSYDRYDISSLVLKGLCYYNLKRFSEAEKTFSICHRITKCSITKYYLQLSIDTKETPELYERLEYFFAVPKKEAERRFDVCKNILKYGVKAFKKIKKRDLFDILEWLYSFDNKLQLPICDMLLGLSSPSLRKFYLNKLLDSSVNDEVKSTIIAKLVESGYDKKVGVVFGCLFGKIQLLRAEFDKEKNDIFMQAYANAFGKIAPIEPERAYKIREGAYELYYQLKENGNIRKITDINALSASIVIFAGLNISSKRAMVANYFYSTIEEVAKIIDMAGEE